MSEKKHNVRSFKRAGLHIPHYNLRSSIKSAAGKRRIQKNSPICLASYTEFLLTQLLVETSKQLGDEKYIEARHLHKTLNDKSSPVYGVFPQKIGGIH